MAAADPVVEVAAELARTGEAALVMLQLEPLLDAHPEAPTAHDSVARGLHPAR